MQNTEPTTITLGEILEDGLPEDATGVRWTDNGFTETAEEVTDPSNQKTMQGDDYDKSAVAEVLFGDVISDHQQD